MPGKIGPRAVKAALKRLEMQEPDDLMMAIGTRQLSDREVMEALVPGSVNDNDDERQWPEQDRAISIKGLTPGVAFNLAECCHPVPGDRIVGLRRSGKNVEVHTIDCQSLADGVDADWVDLSWGNESDGAAARLSHRDGPFHTFDVDLEVHNVHHLMRILSALRASEAVAQAERS